MWKNAGTAIVINILYFRALIVRARRKWNSRPRSFKITTARPNPASHLCSPAHHRMTPIRANKRNLGPNRRAPPSSALKKISFYIKLPIPQSINPLLYHNFPSPQFPRPTPPVNVKPTHKPPTPLRPSQSSKLSALNSPPTQTFQTQQPPTPPSLANPSY